MTAEPLRIEMDVACAPEHAFDVWTRRTSRWWPPSHGVRGAPVEVVIEGRVGGRIYGRTTDGTEHDWGQVTLWEPSHRLGYLWHLQHDSADATDVVVSFAPSRVGTSLRIVHSGWERLGDDAATFRDGTPHLTAGSEHVNRSAPGLRRVMTRFGSGDCPLGRRRTSRGPAALHDDGTAITPAPSPAGRQPYRLSVARP
jgi:hypothetical protein